jgi:tetratricopeptide (TPR) repeat protein
LDPRGERESAEYDAVCDQMDRPWNQMNGQERARVKGLSQDLYALADGRQGVAMSPEERQRWARQANEVLPLVSLAGEVDAVLDFLRQPFPNDIPPYTVPFLQGRCWERLDEDEVALVFMKEAEHFDPRQAVCVLLILQRLGRSAEAAESAERIVANPDSSGEELYQAAGEILKPVRQMRAAEAKPVLERIVGILERALKAFIKTPKSERDIQDADRYIIAMLGFCHEQLGNVKKAVQLYSDGLARYPRDAELLSFRGLALIDTDVIKALDDCQRAVQAGSLSMWPYYFLAWNALRLGNFAEAWQFSLSALQHSGGSNREKAQLHEWLGIALAESGQHADWVLHNFRQAEALDPGNARIQRNHSLAEARVVAPGAVAQDRWAIDGRASSEQALRGAFPADPPTPDLFVERSDRSLAAVLKVA